MASFAEKSAPRQGDEAEVAMAVTADEIAPAQAAPAPKAKAKAKAKAILGQSWTTLGCDDPNCALEHSHTRVLNINPLTSSSSSSSSSSDPSSSSSSASASASETQDADTDAADQSKLAPANRRITPQDVSETAFAPGEDTIFVIGTQGMKVTVIAGLEGFAGSLEVLVLRSNLIASLDGVETLSRLQKLELYDNQVETIEMRHLSNLAHLTILDLSFNAIRTMEAVACCRQLKELYLAQNKLKAIEGLAGLQDLEILDLGANRIRTISGCGFDSLVSLRSLWLGKNKIENLDAAGLAPLTRLEKLDVQNNRLLDIPHGELPGSLKELYLACNGIKALGGVCQVGLLLNLNTLDLSSNPLQCLDGIETLGGGLEELWLTSVQIQEVAQLEPLRGLTRLQCLYLEHSPVMKALSLSSSNIGDQYRTTLRALVPSLIQIDALML